MERFPHFHALCEEVSHALEQTFSKYGIDSPYKPLAVCAVLEAISSPLKFQIQATPLTKAMGKAGLEAYRASILARAVEVLKSPHSLVVNPMMDAIALAIARHQSPLPDDDLLHAALKVILNRPRLSKAGMQAALQADASLTAGFDLARGYLEEGGVIARTEDGRSWSLSI